MGKWNMFDWLNKREEEKKEIRYILSIDGGGMRGVVPAYLLSKLNKKLKEYSDRPLYSYFDLIAGTSTGALLALGLSLNNSNSSLKLEAGADYPLYETRKYKRLFKIHSEQVLKGYIKKSTDPDALVSLYKENGCKIFHQPSHFKKILGNVFSDKYDASSLESFMNEIYGDTPLSDALVPTMATAFEPLTSKPYVFTSWDSHGFLIKEAARASSAAPTFFSPITLIDRETTETITLVDGGLYANNPILAAYNEARKLYPNADEFRVISLSTCAVSSSFNASEAGGGISAWISSLWKSYASGTMEFADSLAQNIKDLKYLRIWDNVVKKKFSLDDYSDEAVTTLLNAAETLYQNKKDEIERFLEDLVNNANNDVIKFTEGKKEP
ncbi:MAG: patatin-like phospholipase family protein, partial [Spirochaetales bacterium]|nr:patatin-like phospholipase family protein [Spirochaetales bacterium]